VPALVVRKALAAAAEAAAEAPPTAVIAADTPAATAGAARPPVKAKRAPIPTAAPVTWAAFTPFSHAERRTRAAVDEAAEESELWSFEEEEEVFLLIVAVFFAPFSSKLLSGSVSEKASRCSKLATLGHGTPSQ
jgi:hypothetical protein